VSEHKVVLAADNVGELMHTAMRKRMDTRASSYAWNAVHLLNETWRGFCDAVVEAEAMDGAELRAVFENGFFYPDPNVRTKESFYARQIWRIAMEDFDATDWNALASYFNEEG